MVFLFWSPISPWIPRSELISPISVISWPSLPRSRETPEANYPPSVSLRCINPGPRGRIILLPEIPKKGAFSEPARMSAGSSPTPQ